MVFQYQPDAEDLKAARNTARAAAAAAAVKRAGPSKPQRPSAQPPQRLIEDDYHEDYDVEAALEAEQRDSWEDEASFSHHQAGPSSSRYVPVAGPSSGSRFKASVTNGKHAVAKAAPAPSIKRTHRGSSTYIDDEDEDMIPALAHRSGSTASTAQIEQLNREIQSIDEQISSLKAARALLDADREQLLAQQRQAQKSLKHNVVGNTANAKPPRSARSIDYSRSDQFTWKKRLDATLQKVFGISKLRLCQEGVLNAVLDGRDVICIMPTGGGKSVCFQAPALMTQGVTLVISPLLSLMADQVLTLRQKGVKAVMITGSTSHSDLKEITQQLTSPDGNIKLCYVTPEKLAKSKTFTSTLSKMYTAGLLGRIAIDESHCCSQMGHDFRPDYKKLSLLKQLYPDTPIIALTATCGKAVLNDVVRILRLKACTAGESAEPNGTVFFSAPLYRPNLHYSVRVKPAKADALATEMVAEIEERHPNYAGIIYCLSQKETETFAQTIYDQSQGRIKTGTYHAGMTDEDKEDIHTRWREGAVKCVVATIAFGMGIDAPDVRYVFHQTISKSMEGYYQETGRAGRDGKDSDCILWFRPADASRLSSMVVGELEGTRKLHTMLKYTMDYSGCRKLLFDSYFGNPANVVAPYAENDATRCGHCDNCLRGILASSSSNTGGTVQANDETMSAALDYVRHQTIKVRDVTQEAWKACKILQAADRLDSQITVPGAGDLCRGLAKASFSTSKKSKATLDLDAVCGGKITTLSKDDMEVLLVDLTMRGFCSERYVQTGYTTNVYIGAGPQSVRLTRLEASEIDKSGIKIELSTVVPPRVGKSKARDDDENEDDDSDAGSEIKDKGKSKKRQPAQRKAPAPSTADGTEPSTKKGGGRKKKKPSPGDMNSDAAAGQGPAKKCRTKVATDSEDFEDFGFGGGTKQAALEEDGDHWQNDDEDEAYDSELLEYARDRHWAGMPIDGRAAAAEESEESDLDRSDPFEPERFQRKTATTTATASRGHASTSNAAVGSTGSKNVVAGLNKASIAAASRGGVSGNTKSASGPLVIDLDSE